MDKDAARHALTMDQVLMSVKKTFTDPEPVRAVPAGSSRHQIRHPKRFQPLPSPPSAMPLATPSRRPKLPPVPAVLKAREQATFWRG